MLIVVAGRETAAALTLHHHKQFLSAPDQLCNFL